MRQFSGQIQTDKVGSAVEFEFEVEDDASDEDVEKAARDEALSHIEWFYREDH